MLVSGYSRIGSGTGETHPCGTDGLGEEGLVGFHAVRRRLGELP